MEQLSQLLQVASAIATAIFGAVAILLGLHYASEGMKWLRHKVTEYIKNVKRK